MFLINDRAADFLVEQASKQADEYERMARSRDLRGPDNARARKLFRERAYELRCAVSGLNTGEGVTRQSAVS